MAVPGFRRPTPLALPLLAVGAMLAATLPDAVGARPVRAAPPAGPAYSNPVSAGFADTYADPAVIRGKDGWWYAYGTTDPLLEGEGRRHLLPISRSRDLTTWAYVGDAFSEASVPAWADRSRGAALWAPDIRYVNGEYRLYYVVTETTATAEPNDNAIGMATAPTPGGPWTDSGAPVVGPRRGGAGEPGNFLWTFDPHVVVGDGGQQFLFYGSYYGGIWVAPLAADGRSTTSPATRVAVDNKFEGAYVVRRDGWWYLFASTANCCAGPTTGYSVQVGRSRDVRGPYVDREGVPLDQSRAGGTPTIYQNGNRWIGTGHNALVTDLAGQDWAVYHAIDRSDPYLEGTEGINERPMLLDRLDWVDGWPVLRGGLGPSETPQPGPTVSGRDVVGFEERLRGWARDGSWASASGPATGAYAVAGPGRSTLLTHVAGEEVRVEADLRQRFGAPAGLAAAQRPDGRPGHGVVALVDPATRLLTLEAYDRGGAVTRASAPVPPGFDLAAWHSAALELRGDRAYAELSFARLGDPVATVTLPVHAELRASGRAGVVSTGTGTDVDNLSALPAADPPAPPVPPSAPGTLDPAFSDEFDGPALGAGWSWVRAPRGTVTGGALRWPTEAGDLGGPGADVSLLLRTPPPGEWTAETKLSIDLGVDEVRNYSQAGLVAYVDDDLWARLSHVAIWNTRQTEFGKEMPYAGRLAYGGTIVGPPAETTWLRIHHTTSGTGEHLLRASTSRDGMTWAHGGTWTLPAGVDVRIGLISHGGAGATADFDWFHLYRR
ncbi:family 43 glycosylhydrolase [Motilibacter deserti]|uniref:Family 43 glycosylhydrolase n=1 Tax=Motilibacter deserti TaxID=2714956 RepID=A0ABX0GP42_9ACTN|nr:family 43 glycosylhydrolase [Motilibacter deserti]NHC12220.1 family 43 glycosylhydrolase [Motilibacter deserti]